MKMKKVEDICLMRFSLIIVIIFNSLGVIGFGLMMNLVMSGSMLLIRGMRCLILR